MQSLLLLVLLAAILLTVSLVYPMKPPRESVMRRAKPPLDESHSSDWLRNDGEDRA